MAEAALEYNQNTDSAVESVFARRAGAGNGAGTIPLASELHEAVTHRRARAQAEGSHVGILAH